MTKKKLHETVLGLCATHKASKALTAALDELTKPKVGGSSDVNDYTVFGEDGKPAYIFCTYHKKWEPVVAEDEEGNAVALFKESAKSKNGYERSCIMGASQWNEQAKIFNASKSAVMSDVLDEAITGADGKAAIAELQAARDNRLTRTDGIGTEERPEV